MAKSAPVNKVVVPSPLQPAEGYRFLLFITGATPNSVRAISNVKQFCENHLAGRFSLEIIDVYQQKDIASKYQLVALPLLLKESPAPQRRMIGDFSDTKKVLTVLNLS